MLIDVKIPSPGESIVNVQILAWHVEDGAVVSKDEILFDIETEKATMTIQAEASGKIKIKMLAGLDAKVDSVVATIDTSSASDSLTKDKHTKEETSSKHYTQSDYVMPSAAKLMREHNLKPKEIHGSGRDGRVTKADVFNKLETTNDSQSNIDRDGISQIETKETSKVAADKPGQRRVRMSMLRQSLSKRLVSVKNQTAMLTTFNEVDMSELQKLRAENAEQFQKKYGVKLGLMSFFTKASTFALKDFPSVNAMIDGNDIVYHDYVEIGIAVSTDRGLLVPVVRGCEKLTLAQIEQEIFNLAQKARDQKLSISDMSGGTFTITNGGVFGSLLSTPILNPPQCAILGMHAITDRAVVKNGQIVVRAMMNLALSYDHRLIDGKESVGFLMRIKELIENPKGLFEEVL